MDSDTSATYNITNNRLKLKIPRRLNDAEYKTAKAANFQWWPGQKVFSAVWTPQGEDFIKSLGVEITEDDTPDDLEARVNRFQKYAANDENTAAYATQRASEATTARRARQAESTAARALDEAHYWQRRIAGAIASAQHKERPDVIARRIKGLEADQRKHKRAQAEHETMLKVWSKDNLTYEQALYIANRDPSYLSFRFTPDKYPLSTYAGDQSIWSALNKKVIDAPEAAHLAIEAHTSALTHAVRWIEHLTMRLDYERAYLVAAGGEALLNPEKKPRAVRKAPEDGLKKGDIVSFPWGYSGEYVTGKIISLGAVNVRVEVPPKYNQHGYYNKGCEVLRRYAKKVG